jgi:peptidoglycan-associated lipoprotein
MARVFILIAFLFIFPVCCAKKVAVEPEKGAGISKEACEREEAARREAEEREMAIREEKLAEAERARELAEAALMEFDPSEVIIQFNFDNYSLKEEAKEKLARIGSWLLKYPGVKIQIEGHCCEIGTNEYNLALGEMRARSAKKYLKALGVDESRISTISYGEERPLDPGHFEEARAKNRRDQFVVIAK